MAADIEASPTPAQHRWCYRFHGHIGRVGRQRRRSGRELVGEAGTHEVDGLPAAPVGKAAGAWVDDERCGFLDCSEIVVQIFDTSDPVGGAEADFTADAGHPAEVIPGRYIVD